MSEDAHGAAQDVTSAHPLTPTRLPPSAYETTYTDHSLTTARLSPAAFETDTDDSVTTTCLSPTAYEADTDHSLTTTRLSPSAYETDTNDSLTISRLSHSAYEAETDRSLTTTRLSLSACETDTDHSPTATRLSPSAYEADPDHSHAPFLHRRSREGRATHQHTVVDIPAFEGQQKCEDLDTDSDDSREPLIRIQTDFTSDKSEEEEDDDETEEEKEDSENEEEAEESENEEEEESEEEAEEEEEDQFKEEEGLFSKQKDYPISIYFILGSEFCERFTYFGLRTILVLYLTNWLQLAKNQATAVFHLFSSLAYCSPILGAILADSYIGRYKTILYISMVYATGCHHTHTHTDTQTHT
ncbi:hypothetical protein ACOMHN_002061 [Nucella lapillus]